MSDTLKQIGEAWESVLLEMDSKLESFAEKLPAQDGMAADFLELLVFVYTSSKDFGFLPYLGRLKAEILFSLWSPLFPWKPFRWHSGSNQSLALMSSGRAIMAFSRPAYVCINQIGQL